MASEQFTLPGNRGQILALLRGGSQTVNDLAESLGMTDNGVRAHLATLQAEGLVKLDGERPGTRKPHQLFALTPAGRKHFPNAEGALLNQLLSTLAGTMTPKALNGFLRKIGARLAEAHQCEFANATPEKRLKVALKILGRIGGDAEIQHEKGKTVIQGRHCPLSNLVPAHPEVCAVAQGLLERVLDRPIEETCQKGRNPCCRFELDAA